jgi:hypothetical protein
MVGWRMVLFDVIASVNDFTRRKGQIH